MRQFFAAFYMCFFCIMVGCSVNDRLSGDMIELIKADLMLPEKVDINQKKKFQVKVTQANIPVEEADKVQFMVWNYKDGRSGEFLKLIDRIEDMDDLSKYGAINARHIGEGVYEIESTIQQSGIYYIQAHVTYEAVHAMPRTSFVAGEVSDQEKKAFLESQKDKKKDEGKTTKNKNDIQKNKTTHLGYKER